MMRKVFVLVSILALMVFATGCAKKYVKTPEEVKAEMERKKAEEVTEEVVAEKISPEEVREEVLSVVEESLFEFKDVLFDFDKYNIRPDARDVLDSVSTYLNKNKDVNVLIEGHCDERGTNEYNLALGEKRSKAARDYLLSMGIAHARISIITYGEEKPLCTEHNETCWQSNRRANFVVTK